MYVNTLEAWIHQKKTKLDMLASQLCMLEVGSICMSFFLVLHIVFGVLLAGEMHSQHMMYNNQNIYALNFFLVIDMVVWSTSKLSWYTNLDISSSFFLLVLICSLCCQERQPSSAGAALLAPWRWLSTSLTETPEGSHRLPSSSFLALGRMHLQLWRSLLPRGPELGSS